MDITIDAEPLPAASSTFATKILTYCASLPDGKCLSTVGLAPKIGLDGEYIRSRGGQPCLRDVRCFLGTKNVWANPATIAYLRAEKGAK